MISGIRISNTEANAYHRCWNDALSYRVDADSDIANGLTPVPDFPAEPDSNLKLIPTDINSAQTYTFWVKTSYNFGGEQQHGPWTLVVEAVVVCSGPPRLLSQSGGSATYLGELVSHSGSHCIHYTCSVCEGDCDSDSECPGNLKCHHRDPLETTFPNTFGVEAVGCSGIFELLTSFMDYCYDDTYVAHVSKNAHSSQQFELPTYVLEEQATCPVTVLAIYESSDTGLTVSGVTGLTNVHSHSIPGEYTLQINWAAVGTQIAGYGNFPSCETECDNDSTCKGF